MKNAIRNLSGLTLLGVMLFTVNLTFAQTPATPPSQTNPPPQTPAAPNQGTKSNTP